MADTFATPADAAWAILVAFQEGNTSLTRKAASFVGETLVDPTKLSDKQDAWLRTLLTKAGLPALADRGGAHG